ncbi:MAG: sporulation inhibitor of replication protein SirA [bacterium]|nr:sporulation inhibitor of replication protein SirA [bacterium]
MRTYHIFKINKFFFYMYKKNPYKVYKILEGIYKSEEYDILLSYKMFKQIVIPLNSKDFTLSLKQIYKDNNNYYYNNNIHILNNKCEYSKLIVNKTNLKLKSSINLSPFLNNIANFSDNIIICDFKNKDYFWLNEIIKKDCQTSKFLVQ